MPGLVPGIHVFGSVSKKDVDGRDKPGHDGGEKRRPEGVELVIASESEAIQSYQNSGSLRRFRSSR